MTNQRDRSRAASDAMTETVDLRSQPAAPGSDDRDDAAGSGADDDQDDPRDLLPLTREAAFPTWTEAPVSSNVRKENVRAALFRKLEPVRIGRFILLEPLGHGAMGEIYAAYDDQLDRRVALKLVRSGSEPSAKADERLLREAQTLAQVSHPNVVQIYEAGAYNGRLFIAMELIKGKTLSTWLKDATQVPRAVRQREILRLFIAAGHGLEAAHTAGVAHRDFKPDNVIVGDDGRVRVVDFGLARALGEEPEAVPTDGELEAELAPAPRERTVTMDRDDTLGDAMPLVTSGLTIDVPSSPAHPPQPSPSSGASSPSASSASGANPESSGPRLKAAVRLTETGTVMGTPFFMAPEQMRGAIADRRSDQFSFCVALYHSLYDTFPFSGKTLRELTDSMESDQVAFVPSVPVPGYIRKALARGLSVEPAQRFPTMTELLAALSPKTRKLRNRLLAAGGVAILALAAVAGYSQLMTDPCAAAGSAIDGAWSADHQTAIQAAFTHGGLPLADSTWSSVKSRVDNYASHWRGEATAACEATHVTHTQSPQQLDRRMLCLDRGRRQLAALTSELTTGASDAVEHAVEAAEALPDLESCSKPENLVFGLEPPPLPIASKVAAIRDQIAHARMLEIIGHYDESQTAAREASAAAERLGYAPLRGEALAQTAQSTDGGGATDTLAEAERLYFDALDIAEAERHDQLAVQIWNRLVLLAVRRDASMQQAHAWWRRNAAAVHRLEDDAHDDAKLHHMLGEIYVRESRYSEAVDEERHAITSIARAPGHQLDLIRYDDSLAKSLERMGRLDDALQLQERALAIAVDALGPHHVNVIKLETNYGWTLEKAGHFDRARSILAGALDSMSEHDRKSHPDAGRIYGFLSELEYSQGNLDRAADYARQSALVYQQLPSPDPVKLAESRTNLANVEFRRKHFAEALAIYEDTLAVRRRYLGDNHFQVAFNEGAIAETLYELSRSDEALTHLIDAEHIFAQGSAHERGTQAWLLTVRGEILAAKQQPTAAVPSLERALEMFGDGVADPSNYARALWTLARALDVLGKDRDRVLALAERAQASFASQGAVEAGNRDAVASFLARLSPPLPQHQRNKAQSEIPLNKINTPDRLRLRTGSNTPKETP